MRNSEGEKLGARRANSFRGAGAGGCVRGRGAPSPQGLVVSPLARRARCRGPGTRRWKVPVAVFPAWCDLFGERGQDPSCCVCDLGQAPSRQAGRSLPPPGNAGRAVLVRPLPAPCASPCIASERRRAARGRVLSSCGCWAARCWLAAVRPWVLASRTARSSLQRRQRLAAARQSGRCLGAQSIAGWMRARRHRRRRSRSAAPRTSTCTCPRKSCATSWIPTPSPGTPVQVRANWAGVRLGEAAAGCRGRGMLDREFGLRAAGAHSLLHRGLRRPCHRHLRCSGCHHGEQFLRGAEGVSGERACNTVF